MKIELPKRGKPRNSIGTGARTLWSRKKSNNPPRHRREREKTTTPSSGACDRESSFSVFGKHYNRLLYYYRPDGAKEKKSKFNRREQMTNKTLGKTVKIPRASGNHGRRNWSLLNFRCGWCPIVFGNERARVCFTGSFSPCLLRRFFFFRGRIYRSDSVFFFV